MEAAGKYGDIVDLSFPAVSPYAEEIEIAKLANEYADRIIAMKPQAVLCQGEFSLCFGVAQLLIKNNIVTLCTCSERITNEYQNPDGTMRKESIFDFKKFRKYELIGEINNGK